MISYNNNVSLNKIFDDCGPLIYIVRDYQRGWLSGKTDIGKSKIRCCHCPDTAGAAEDRNNNKEISHS